MTEEDLTHYVLRRDGRAQAIYILLRETRRRNRREQGRMPREWRRTEEVGTAAAETLDRGAGSNNVQPLDLLRTRAVRLRAADGASRRDEGDQLRQKEERPI